MTNPKTKHFSSQTGFLFTGIDGDRNEGTTARPLPPGHLIRAMAEMFEDGVIMNVVNIDPASLKTPVRLPL